MAYLLHFFLTFSIKKWSCNGGIKINGTSYNLFVYADDILLTSLTATGLQTMINVADKYITDHGLRFNPSKTECTIFGKCHLDPPPEWRLGGTHLVQTNSVNYLGVTLSHCKPHEHVDKRIIVCRRAYFALQGAGFNNTVTDVDAFSYIWKAAIRPNFSFNGVLLLEEVRCCLHNNIQNVSNDVIIRFRVTGGSMSQTIAQH